MDNNKRQASSVLFGDTLNKTAPSISPQSSGCILSGTDTAGASAQIPLSYDVLSKHIMLLGGIGTGKTNALFQITSQLSKQINENDIVVIFDTKGDFYKEFYKPGDAVISNNELSCGEKQLDYWNIFNEFDRGARLNEDIIEISRSLFAEACKKTNQVFFPNAARDIFMACILHFVRSVPLAQQTNENLNRFICINSRGLR